MRMAEYAMKYGRWLPFLAGLILFGCAGGSQQQKGSWPWGYDRQEGRYPTGDYAAVSGTVAKFGGAPKAVKPVTPESRAASVPDANPPSGASVAKTPPPLMPAVGKPGSGTIVYKAKREYDFTVSETKIATPSYLPVGSVRPAYDITAGNHGNAPVSVTIGSDPNSSQNMATDKALPLTAVIPPNTDQALVHVTTKVKNEAYKFGYTCSWSIGDYTARHHCPEQYRFPFGDTIRAFAGVNDAAGSTPSTRFAVIFSLPAATPVLAARKGTVVQIGTSGDRIDILHDDSTIATYSHLGTIAEGVMAGKAVATGDVIGTAGAAGNQKEAYLQFVVWRPEPRPGASLTANSPGPGYDLVSFPLEFCGTNSKECKVLTQSQWVSRNKMAEVKKQGKRGVKSAVRKDGGS